MYRLLPTVFRAIACAAVAALHPVSAAEPLEIFSYPITLDPADPFRIQFGALQWRGGSELRSPHARFGGLSALEFPNGDDRFVAISDLGFRIDGRLVERPNEPIEWVDTTISPLRAINGALLGTGWRDAEALAPDGSGGVFMSFEGQHRLLHYHASPVASAERIAAPRGMSSLPKNTGVEAITRLCDGRLLLITEHPDANGYAPSWAGIPAQDGAWLRLRYPVSDDFVPTGVTTLPDCRVAVLERRFSLVRGFAARVRRLDIVPDDESALVPITLAQIESPLLTDNFEGIAAKRNPEGETLLYILSDDNYIALERTLLLIFALPSED